MRITQNLTLVLQLLKIAIEMCTHIGSAIVPHYRNSKKIQKNVLLFPTPFCKLVSPREMLLNISPHESLLGPSLFAMVLFS
jgi:hypothetical protein